MIRTILAAALLSASTGLASAATITPMAGDIPGSDNFAELDGLRARSIETNVGTFTGGSDYGLRVQNDSSEWNRRAARVDSRWDETMSWVLPEGARKVSFTVQDGFDRPNWTESFTMTAGDSSYSFAATATGNRQSFSVLFGADEDAVIDFARVGKGICGPGTFQCDGWAVGDVSVAPAPTPVPLPAAAWMLLASLGGMFGVRRMAGRSRSEPILGA